jgi:hypothetical protein
LRLTTLWGFPCCARFPCVRAAATTLVQWLGPKDHVAVALARPVHGPQTGEDGIVQLNEAFAALVGLGLVANAA